MNLAKTFKNKTKNKEKIMPTTQTYWCTNCQSHKQAWNDEPNRCWNCDKYTLANSITIRGSQSVTTTQAQRQQLGREMAHLVRETGMEFEAKIEARTYPDGSSSTSQSIIVRPPK